MKLSGNFLRFTRNMMQLSQTEMAEKLGVTRILIALIETEKRIVTPKTEKKFWAMLETEGLGLFELTELYDRYQKMKRGIKDAD